MSVKIDVYSAKKRWDKTGHTLRVETLHPDSGWVVVFKGNLFECQGFVAGALHFDSILQQNPSFIRIIES